MWFFGVFLFWNSPRTHLDAYGRWESNWFFCVLVKKQFLQHKNLSKWIDELPRNKFQLAYSTMNNGRVAQNPWNVSWANEERYGARHCSKFTSQAVFVWAWHQVEASFGDFTLGDYCFETDLSFCE
jgi:hypothetical protein